MRCRRGRSAASLTPRRRSARSVGCCVPAARSTSSEHGRAPDDKVRRWQSRLNGVQQRVACGCHLDRDIPALIEQGGMTVTSLDTSYMPGEPKILGWTFRGTAQAASRTPA